jgi:bifunctional aspartokinase / homoserine dehydrogenase 1
MNRSNNSADKHVGFPPPSGNGTFAEANPQIAPAPVAGFRTSATQHTLRVLKFGGTSVGDATCILRVAEIIRSAAQESDLAVVVSAIGGVTNQLVEASAQAEAGNEKAVAGILQKLRQQHEAVLLATLQSPGERKLTASKIDRLFKEGDLLCTGTMLLRQLAPRVRDAISSLGERLSVLLVAAALRERGVAAQAIEATELIVTDSGHGAAEPQIDLTRTRCEARLRPLLEQGVVPVITGFIGATPEGVLTTLGRGGSDYSATILAAVLQANEVIIWTDVDGLLTADPRVVPDARALAEVSYREAAELAYFGSKVLHPKTIRPLMEREIPLWIRNTFSPDKPGTKIVRKESGERRIVTALTAVIDAARITIGGPGIAGVPDVLGRTLAVTRRLRADVLLVSQSSSQNDVCLVVPANVGMRTVDELRREFAEYLNGHPVEHIAVDSSVAVVSAVSNRVHSLPGILGRAFGALNREGVEVIAVAHGALECNLSIVVARQNMKPALLALHREFRLDACDPEDAPNKIPAHPTGSEYSTQQLSATGD